MKLSKAGQFPNFAPPLPTRPGVPGPGNPGVPPLPDTSSINPSIDNLARLQAAVSRYDIDKNGGLDRAEIALGSLHARQQGDIDSRGTSILLAIFLQGGDDGKGLFPDLNGDQLISKDELAHLASQKGSNTLIDGSDLQAQFPENFQQGNVTLNFEALEQIAQRNRNKFSLPGVLVNLLRNNRDLLRLILNPQAR